MTDIQTAAKPAKKNPDPVQTQPPEAQPAEPEPPRAPEPPKKAPAYSGQMKESQFTVRDYTITLPPGHTVNDALRPEYWAHHAAKLDAPNGRDRQGDRVTIKDAHGDWEATLRVVAKGDSWVKMAVLTAVLHKGNGADPEPADAVFKVQFVPPGQWNVVNRRSGKIEAGPFSDKALAYKSRDDLVAKLNR